MTRKWEGRAVSVWAILFNYGLDELRRAYEAAREASDRDRARLDRQWEEWSARSLRVALSSSRRTRRVGLSMIVASTQER